MSNPGQLAHLIEPGAGILQPERSIEAQFRDILYNRDKLKQRYDEQGIEALSGEERVQLAAANIIEAQLPGRRKKFAVDILQRRANSPKLVDRFLCAVFPPYLGVKPDSFAAGRAAKKELLAEYRSVVTRWAEGDMREKLEKLFIEEIARANILEKPMTVRKPLTLKAPS
jgi:hypothetical protein